MNQFKRKSSIKELQDRKFKTYTKKVEREFAPFEPVDTHAGVNFVVKPMASHIHVDGLAWLKDEKIKLFARYTGNKYNYSFCYMNKEGDTFSDGAIYVYSHAATLWTGSRLISMTDCRISYLLHELGHAAKLRLSSYIDYEQDVWKHEVYASRWALRWVRRLLPETYETALQELATALSHYNDWRPARWLTEGKPITDCCREWLDVRIKKSGCQNTKEEL